MSTMSNNPDMTTFTCITCRVAFRDAEFQRQHYKDDWHRYNLKRKVVQLPPVPVEEFHRRVLLQREQDKLDNNPVSVHCKTCRKLFSSQNAYDNHLNSKKHREGLIALGLNEDDVSSVSGHFDSAVDSQDSSNVSVVEQAGTDDSDFEEVDSDEWENEYAENPIPNNNCLFCSHHSRNMNNNLRHMTIDHSFFIPDIEYVTDLKGLLTYLGEKVSQGFMCLWCNDKGRSFQSSDAAKQHMIDKGHCKMLHEGESLIEYADFYDYSSSYPQDHKGTVDEEVTVPVIEDSDYQLVLPSGATIGHRSLMRYYRQSLNPNRPGTHQKKLHRLLVQYRALGWRESQKEIVARKARDMDYMKRIKSKYFTQLGVKNNKMQKHFRAQVNF
ncbi:cytoplasmic 60S subunit biogenesis factor ZNF622 [Bacillus rossius redtenbacheri]|uniref:cytoplasmic 60S subunit biogenesis factor ZNF622 n=1 Tax=Bacillus rossius redtenbacheri TaxID=93214 RepID=UPI002FDE7491